MPFMEAEWTTRLGWLVRLRWLAAVGIVVFGTFAGMVLGFPIPLPHLVWLAVTVAVYNLLFYLLLRSQRSLNQRRAAQLAHAQITADLLALAVLVHLTGGIENPFAAYFVFHMIIASILMTRYAALAHATLACLLFGAVIFLEGRGFISHLHLRGIADPDLFQSPAAWWVFAVWASVLYITTFLASSIAGRLHERERELEQLTSELAEVARTRQEALERLEKTQKAQVNYMRKVSHELRRPLAAAVTLIKVVVDALGGQISDKLHNMLQRATVRIEQGLDMVGDLLVLSQVRDAPLAETIEDVDIGRVLEMVVDMETDRAQQKNVRLVTNIPKGLPTIRGQHEALGTAVANLVANAIRYSPPGSEVRIEAVESEDGVAITVADEGLGIARDEIPRIFEEFYRSRRARSWVLKAPAWACPLSKASSRLTADASRWTAR